MNKLSVRDLEVHGQRVLVRVDFNVPTEEREGKIAITDDTRIRESLPTINYLRENGAKTILMAHFGRPKGKPVEKYSLRPVADYLHELIEHPVAFSHDTIGKIPEEIIAHMNADHAEAVRLYATNLLGARDGEWRCVGCDPEGLELQRRWCLQARLRLLRSLRRP